MAVIKCASDRPHSNFAGAERGGLSDPGGWSQREVQRAALSTVETPQACRRRVDGLGRSVPGNKKAVASGAWL